MASEPDPVRAERGVATWVPPDGRIVVQGRSIAGGMVYVGREAPSASGYWTEPSLIDPDLAVDWKRPDRDGLTLADWPSYHDMDPRGRAGYLAWLAGGRMDELAHIGYVFLFLYGLERRLLVDIGHEFDNPDYPVIAGEIVRLLMIYGVDDSFYGSAMNLLALVDALIYAREDFESFPWYPDRMGSDNPLAVVIGIGKHVRDGSGIPAQGALGYLRHHPETRLRTAAERCPDEFDELFVALYHARFGDGIRARRPARSLTLRYQAESHGFKGMMVFPTFPDTPGLADGFELGYGGEVTINLDSIPDITTTPSLIRKLWRLAEECTDELDTYSRFIGRNPDGAQTAAAVSLLPEALLVSRGGSILDGLRIWTSEMLDGGRTAVVPLNELVERWSPGHNGKLTKREAGYMASLLGKIGVGMEPDVRFGAPIPRPGTSAVLFRLPAGAADEPSPAYMAAKPLVHLSAVVAAADGSIRPDQQRFVADRLERVPGLDAAERRRLVAHIEFLTTGRLGMYGVKRKVEAIPTEGRADLGTFLIGVATAGGAATREEVTALETMFGYLGLDESDVYRHLHGLDIGEQVPALARGTTSEARGTLPDADADAEPGPAVALDPAKVRARLADTARVSALLTDIFTDEDAPPEPASAPNGGGTHSFVEGLDEPHSQLVRALAARPQWDRGSVDELARSFGLPFTDSALDVIDEVAIEISGEPMIECHDPVVLNTYAVKEMT